MARYDSTNIPLAANGVYTSDTFVTGLDDTISGAVFADQTGTVFIEQSNDLTNWDISTSYAISASNGKGFSEALLLPYARVRYVNGTTLQGAFRMSTRLRASGSST